MKLRLRHKYITWFHSIIYYAKKPRTAVSSNLGKRNITTFFKLIFHIETRGENGTCRGRAGYPCIENIFSLMSGHLRISKMNVCISTNLIKKVDFMIN